MSRSRGGKGGNADACIQVRATTRAELTSLPKLFPRPSLAERLTLPRKQTSASLLTTGSGPIKKAPGVGQRSFHGAIRRNGILIEEPIGHHLIS